MSADLFAFQLRVASDSETGAFEVTISLEELELKVDVTDMDLRRAVMAAAKQCAERLCVKGYDVSASDVMGALGNALEVAHSKPQALN